MHETEINAWHKRSVARTYTSRQWTSVLNKKYVRIAVESVAVKLFPLIYSLPRAHRGVGVRDNKLQLRKNVSANWPRMKFSFWNRQDIILIRK